MQKKRTVDSRPTFVDLRYLIKNWLQIERPIFPDEIPEENYALERLWIQQYENVTEKGRLGPRFEPVCRVGIPC